MPRGGGGVSGLRENQRKTEKQFIQVPASGNQSKRFHNNDDTDKINPTANAFLESKFYLFK